MTPGSAARKAQWVASPQGEVCLSSAAQRLPNSGSQNVLRVHSHFAFFLSSCRRWAGGIGELQEPGEKWKIMVCHLLMMQVVLPKALPRKQIHHPTLTGGTTGWSTPQNRLGGCTAISPPPTLLPSVHPSRPVTPHPHSHPAPESQRSPFSRV